MNPTLDALLPTMPMHPIANPVVKSGIPYPTHEGWFDFGPFSIRAYRLSNGVRAWDADDLAKLLGETKSK